MISCRPIYITDCKKCSNRKNHFFCFRHKFFSFWEFDYNIYRKCLYCMFGISYVFYMMHGAPVRTCYFTTLKITTERKYKIDREAEKIIKKYIRYSSFLCKSVIQKIKSNFTCFASNLKTCKLHIIKNKQAFSLVAPNRCAYCTSIFADAFFSLECSKLCAAVLSDETRTKNNKKVCACKNVSAFAYIDWKYG